MGVPAAGRSAAQRAAKGTTIKRSAYKMPCYQNKDTKLEPKQDKRSHRDITKTQRVLLDKIGTPGCGTGGAGPHRVRPTEIVIDNLYVVSAFRFVRSYLHTYIPPESTNSHTRVRHGPLEPTGVCVQVGGVK